MSLIDNLNAINNCKEDIKTALINKGVDMNGVIFSDYAEKINELQFGSGGSTVDYLYSNGYLTGGTEVNEIIEFVAYEIVLDDEGKFIINLTCPEEIPGYEGGYCDIILTMDIPTAYEITKFEYYDQGTGQYYVYNIKPNPRHSTIIRNGVEYNSYVRQMTDNVDYGSAYLAYLPLQYRITIEKK